MCLCLKRIELHNYEQWQHLRENEYLWFNCMFIFILLGRIRFGVRGLRLSAPSPRQQREENNNKQKYANHPTTVARQKGNQRSRKDLNAHSIWGESLCFPRRSMHRYRASYRNTSRKKPFAWRKHNIIYTTTQRGEKYNLPHGLPND